MRAFLCLTVLSLVACRPPIRVPPPGSVTRTERSAKEVQLCHLTQERDVRSRFLGVAEASRAPWQYSINSIAIVHPDAGLLVLDPAFSQSIRSDLAKGGPLFTAVLGSADTKTPLVEVMRRAGLDPADVRFALVTHVHWDHTGALGDLPNATVLVNETDLEWMRHFTRAQDHGTMPFMLKRAKDRLRSFAVKGPPLDGFEHSFDLFGDGSIVGVPLPGHTPGSMGWLVRSGGKSWLFSGDATWTVRGVEAPEHKTLTAFDDDLEVLGQTIGRLNAFSRERPDVVVVPAHDAEAVERLPACATLFGKR